MVFLLNPTAKLHTQYIHNFSQKRTMEKPLLFARKLPVICLKIHQLFRFQNMYIFSLVYCDELVGTDGTAN